MVSENSHACTFAFVTHEQLRWIESAVWYIHSLGLAHNNIKLGNVMLNEHDIPYIIDYGSCLPLGSLLITAGTLR